MSALGVNLTRLLKERRMTVAGLSKETGVPRSNISGWIKDNVSPNINQIYKVATFFGVSIEYLVFGVQPQMGESEIIRGVFEVSMKRIDINP